MISNFKMPPTFFVVCRCCAVQDDLLSVASLSVCKMETHRSRSKAHLNYSAYRDFLHPARAVYTQNIVEDPQKVFRELDKEVKFVRVAGKKRALFGKFKNVKSLKIDGLRVNKFTPTIKLLLEEVRRRCDCNFNYVVATRFKNGDDHYTKQETDQMTYKHGAPVATLLLGASRLSYYDSRALDQCDAKLLENGSLSVVKLDIGQRWNHFFDKDAACNEPTIVLTFRRAKLQDHHLIPPVTNNFFRKMDCCSLC